MLDGLVAQVHVRDGDRVRAGDVLAEMEDFEYRAAVNAARAQYNAARLKVNRALASGDGSEAGVQGIEAEYWNSELARAEQRLEHTKLRAPFEGTVVGPNLDTAAGQRVQAGDPPLADVVDTTHARVDIAVDESDLPLLTTEQQAAVKFESFPTQTFAGTLAFTSPAGVTFRIVLLYVSAR